jgi:hypothetical protein
MTRVIALGLAGLLALAAPASAADSLLASATRHAHEVARADAAPPAPATRASASSRAARSERAATARSHFADTQDQTTGLAPSGMSKGKKILIGVALAAAFTGVIYAIDHSVEDNTPSSRGLR